MFRCELHLNACALFAYEVFKEHMDKLTSIGLKLSINVTKIKDDDNDVEDESIRSNYNTVSM